MSSLFRRNSLRTGTALSLAGLLWACVVPPNPATVPTPASTAAPTLRQTWEDWATDGAWLAHSYAGGPGGNRFTSSNAEVVNGELFLKVNANSFVGAEVSTTSPVGSYGYYETSMACSPIPGIVCAFFWAGEDGFGEIDVELLSNDPRHVHLVFHKGPGTQSTHEKYALPEGFDITAYHRYGFLYTPEAIVWTIDGEAVWSTPTVPVATTGSIVLNAWSGHKYWGEGPPATDAVSTYDYVVFYEGATVIP